MKKFTIFIALSCFSPSNALAWCDEPSTPMRTPIKPNAPWCVNEWNNTHTCDDWEIEQYYFDLENYQHEADRFVRQLNKYVEDAVEYAECRARELE